MFMFHYEHPLELLATLQKTKEDYHLTNRAIAQALGTTDATVSNWLNQKQLISNTWHDRVEEYIAKTWQPALLCIAPIDKEKRCVFYLVGSKHDPWYTWIHSFMGESEQDAQDELDELIKWERACRTGKAKIHIVKEYANLQEASKIGRDEETLYNMGAMTRRHVACHFFVPAEMGGGFITRYAPLYDPETETIIYYNGEDDNDESAAINSKA